MKTTATSGMRTVEIAPGVFMPMLGLGTFRSTGQDVRSAVATALSCGYRHIDTASVYKNERDIALALQRRRKEDQRGGPTIPACTTSDHNPHDDDDDDDAPVFITSKISPYEMGEERAQAAFDEILQRLGVDRVDLVLIHWPGVARTPPNSPKHAVARRETWMVLESELARGRCRAIGVSNYTVHHLEEMAAYASVLPAVNQVEMHPRCAQRQLLETCARMGITVVAYSPLGCGQLLREPAVVAAAARLGWGHTCFFTSFPFVMYCKSSCTSIHSSIVRACQASSRASAVDQYSPLIDMNSPVVDMNGSLFYGVRRLKRC